MRKFFAFGCSMVDYAYPTWVDFVNLHPSIDRTYNYGYAGAGNKYILSQLLHLLDHYEPTEDDVIAIMFTSSPRYDWINRDGGWILSGNLYNSPLYKRSNIDAMWSTNTGVLDAYVSMESMVCIASRLKCKVIYMSAFGPELSIGEYNTPENDLPNNDRLIKKVSKLHRTLCGDVNIRDLSIAHSGPDKYSFKDRVWDGHPTIEDHRFWVETQLPDFYVDEAKNRAIEWESTFIKKTIAETETEFNASRKTIRLRDNTPFYHIIHVLNH